MQNVPENGRQDLVKLIPSSIINEISCFSFYDNHPRNKRNVDITICTKLGEVAEYFKREIVSSLSLETKAAASEIALFRNSKCDLFYLISAGDELFVLSTGENLQMKKRISNIDSYEVNDIGCRGISCLKVLRKDDAVPLILDDNLDSMGEQALFLEQFKSHDTIPLIKDLMRKHVESKYAVKSNEKALRELVALRQTSAYSTYEKQNPSSMGTLFNTKHQASGVLKVKDMKPWIKMCNKKIVIAVEVLNKGTEPLEDINILLHHTIKSSLVYKSRLFIKTEAVPYWLEAGSQNLNQKSEAAVVCTIDLDELKHSVTSKIQFNIVICYNYKNKEYLISLEDIILSASDVMGEEFDVLHTIKKQGDNYTFLALLATTGKIDVSVRLIKNNQETDLDLKRLFKDILKFENFNNIENVFVHRISPFHILYGVMLVLEENDEADFRYCASIYSRTESQVLALIHYIHDSFPCRVIITPVHYKITSKTEELSQYNEDITPIHNNKKHIIEFGEAVLNQSMKTLEYLDLCMIKMNESKDPNVQSKLGNEIDTFADGVASFKKFRDKMLEEADKGSQSLWFAENVNAMSQGTVIDISD